MKQMEQVGNQSKFLETRKVTRNIAFQRNREKTNTTK